MKRADHSFVRTIFLLLMSLTIVSFRLAMGMGLSRSYEDEEVIWTPEVSLDCSFEASKVRHHNFFVLQGNPTLKNRDKAEILFPIEEKFDYISIIMEPKDFDTEGGVLTM